MATIYRFIVEQKTSGGKDSGGGRKNSPRTTKGAAKKGSAIPLFGGMKGGVEHNRKMRAINPLLNKITGGVWEKGMRLTRAGMGLVKVNPDTGKVVGISGPAIAIIIAYILITLWNGFSKWQQRLREQAEKLNASNYKQLENGGGSIHGAYKITTNWWTGRITYNENK